ncbi:MAG TPA: hypothetical protein VFG49_10375 [Dyella sp.]|uniref:hypothetical protein n=1 Tax=Dyella sp. TaxID=1869338 RepID=UPI002D7798E0|nr:hypothetical protein [Dyella sp.]HET6553933.1 hypothetical protein [Dyella sp.]
MNRQFWLPLMAAVALLSQVSVHASESKPDVKAETKDQFAAVADHVREQMASGGRFQFVSNEEHTAVDKDLSDMQGLYDKFGTVSAMDADSKLKLYNAQTEVNAILTKRDGDRRVCQQEMPTGSNIPKTVCRKYSDIERDQKASQKYMQDRMQVTQPHGGH